jgi:hypothetical protein
VVWLFENKLTQCDEGWRQLNQLYKPLLELLFEKPVSGVLVCKHLTEIPKKLITSLDDVEDGSTFHWLGN